MSLFSSHSHDVLKAKAMNDITQFLHKSINRKTEISIVFIILNNSQLSPNNQPQFAMRKYIA